MNLDSPNDERQTVEFKFESNDYTNTDIQQHKIDLNFKIYPNPTDNGSFRIESMSSNYDGPTKVKIVDLMGK